MQNKTPSSLKTPFLLDNFQIIAQVIKDQLVIEAVDQTNGTFYTCKIWDKDIPSLGISIDELLELITKGPEGDESFRISLHPGPRLDLFLRAIGEGKIIEQQVCLEFQKQERSDERRALERMTPNNYNSQEKAGFSAMERQFMEMFQKLADYEKKAEERAKRERESQEERIKELERRLEGVDVRVQQVESQVEEIDHKHKHGVMQPMLVKEELLYGKDEENIQKVQKILEEKNKKQNQTIEMLGIEIKKIQKEANQRFDEIYMHFKEMRELVKNTQIDKAEFDNKIELLNTAHNEFKDLLLKDFLVEDNFYALQSNSTAFVVDNFSVHFEKEPDSLLINAEHLQTADLYTITLNTEDIIHLTNNIVGSVDSMIVFLEQAIDKDNESFLVEISEDGKIRINSNGLHVVNYFEVKLRKLKPLSNMEKNVNKLLATKSKLLRPFAEQVSKILHQSLAYFEQNEHEISKVDDRFQMAAEAIEKFYKDHCEEQQQEKKSFWGWGNKNKAAK